MLLGSHIPWNIMYTLWNSQLIHNWTATFLPVSAATSSRFTLWCWLNLLKNYVDVMKPLRIPKKHGGEILFCEPPQSILFKGIVYIVITIQRMDIIISFCLLINFSPHPILLYCIWLWLIVLNLYLSYSNEGLSHPQSRSLAENIPKPVNSGHRNFDNILIHTLIPVLSVWLSHQNVQ